MKWKMWHSSPWSSSCWSARSVACSSHLSVTWPDSISGASRCSSSACSSSTSSTASDASFGRLTIPRTRSGASTFSGGGGSSSSTKRTIGLWTCWARNRGLVVEELPRDAGQFRRRAQGNPQPQALVGRAGVTPRRRVDLAHARVLQERVEQAGAELRGGRRGCGCCCGRAGCAGRRPAGTARDQVGSAAGTGRGRALRTPTRSRRCRPRPARASAGSRVRRTRAAAAPGQLTSLSRST